jgi:hypothetical protein
VTEIRERDVSSYWTTSKKRKDTGSRKRKYQIAISGELDLEEAVVLS